MKTQLFNYLKVTPKLNNQSAVAALCFTGTHVLNDEASSQLMYLVDFMVSNKTIVKQTVPGSVYVRGLGGSDFTINKIDLDKGTCRYCTPDGDKCVPAEIELFDNLISVIVAGEVVTIVPIDLEVL